jgi:GNAT superfamily N-acetyltransferase
MPLRQVVPGDDAGLREFIGAQTALHRAYPRAVPPIQADLKLRLSGRAALHADIEHAMFMASNGGASHRALACCAAFVNHRYQEFHKEAVGFVGYFAAEPGAHAQVKEMLLAAEEWLAERGVTRVVAPFNGSFLAGLGARSAEFETEAIFPLPWNPPDYPDYLEGSGYRPSYPWWSYRVDFGSEVYREVSRRAIEQAQGRVRPLDKKQWDAELERFLVVYNEGYQSEWEYQPYTIDQVREVFGPFKPILDARQLLFAEVDTEVVGICFGAPNYNPVLRKLGGKMGFVQQVRFALGARRVRDASLFLVIVLPAHRGKHIGQSLASTLYRRYEELGLAGAEYHIVNDDNLASRSIPTSLGAQGRLLYHNFDKRL